MKYVLWTLQVLLGLLFIFAGVMKFIMPVAEMTKQTPQLSGGFMHFIGLMEILGGLGLILPGVTGIRTELTPLAALGLLIIMIGATYTVITSGQASTAPVTILFALLLAFIAYGRWRLLPHRARVSG